MTKIAIIFFLFSVVFLNAQSITDNQPVSILKLNDIEKNAQNYDEGKGSRGDRYRGQSGL